MNEIENSNNGGSVSQKSSCRELLNITAIIAVSAAGHKVPPFFIVQRKLFMSNLFSSINAEKCKHFSSSLSSLVNEGCFPENGAIQCTENSSMNMEAMSLFIAHMKMFVRIIESSTISYCATIAVKTS